MTSPAPVLELRPSPLTSALYAASFVAAAVIAVTVLRSRAPGLFTVLFLVVLAGIVLINTGLAASRVRAGADGWLDVRNRFSTRRLHRSEVERVSVGRQFGWGSPQRLELVLTDGSTVQLVATQTPALPGTRQRLERQAEQLRAWVTGTALPFPD